MTTRPAFSSAFAKQAFNVERQSQGWLVEQQPAADWTVQAFVPSAWASEPRHGILWTKQTFVPVLTSVRRITEQGALRLTQQRVIRITQRAYIDPWIKNTPSGAAWTVDHA